MTAENSKNEDRYAAHRDPKTGRFQPGNPGGPGQKRIEYEPLPEDYFTVLDDELTPDAWREILQVVIRDAKSRPGHRSREFLARYVVASADKRFGQMVDAPADWDIVHVISLPPHFRDDDLTDIDDASQRGAIRRWLARAPRSKIGPGYDADFADLRKTAHAAAHGWLVARGLLSPGDDLSKPVPFGSNRPDSPKPKEAKPDDAPQDAQDAPKPPTPPKDTQPARSGVLGPPQHVVAARQAARGAQLLQNAESDED